MRNRTWMAMVSGACGVCFAAAGLAEASTAVYADRSTWESAVNHVFEEEFFSDAVLNPGISVATVAGYVGSGMWQDRLTTSQRTTWTFDDAMIGYGGNWDLAGPSGTGMGIALYLDGALVGTEISEFSAGEFFGLVSSVPFNEVRLAAGTQGGSAETYTLDNMVYAVPEPAALSLLALSAVAFLRRKRNTPLREGRRSALKLTCSDV